MKILRAALATAFVLVALPTYTFAQQEVVPTVSDILKHHQFDAAVAKLAQFAAKYPTSADVPMMMGNVIWNRYMTEHYGVQMEANSDESIFETSLGSMHEPIYIAPDTTVRAIEQQWLHALDLDPTRVDIAEGLSTIYSYGLQEPKLEVLLDRMRTMPGGDTVDPYTLAAYAQNMIDRSDFLSGMKLYRYLVNRFPAQKSGLLSDMAAQYQMHDSLDLAIAYIDSAMAAGQPDALVYGNAFQFDCWNLRTDLAQKDITELAKLQKNRHDAFFGSFRKYLDADTSWRASLMSYLAHPGDTVEEEDILARVLAQSDESADALLAALDSTRHSSYAILLADHAMKLFPRDRRFYYRFADEEARCGNYRIAADAMARAVAHSAVDPTAGTTNWLLLHAWVLERSGKRAEAADIWKSLIGSDNEYASAAGSYFYAKSLIATKHAAAAKPVLKAAMGLENNNKYTMMCQWLLQDLN